MRAPLDAIAYSRRFTTCRVGLCLYYVQTWLGAPWSGPDALWAWRNARYKRTSWPPPAGFPVFWGQDANTSRYGHIALSVGNGRVRSTDYPYRGRVGEASIATISRHFSRPYLGWTEDLGGVRIPLPKSVNPWAAGPVYLSKLRYGQGNSDSVRRLQYVLNRHKLVGGQTLPVTGNYLRETDEEVRLCQQQHGRSWGEGAADRPLRSNVGPRQAAHLFGSAYTIIR